MLWGYHPVKCEVFRSLFHRRSGMDFAHLCLYVDDRGNGYTDTPVARGFIDRLIECEKEAGFIIKTSPDISDAPDGLNFLSLLIKRVECPVYGPCFHITQPLIIGAMEETLRCSVFHKYLKPTYSPRLLSWSPVESQRQFDLGWHNNKEHPVNPDLYARLLGQFLYAETLSRTSCIASQLASRSHLANDFDMEALVHAVAHRITLADIPVVFAIGQGSIDTTVPPPMFLYVDSGEDGGMKEHGRVSVVVFMGEQDTVSGAVRAMHQSTKMSSNTAHDELMAIDVGTQQAIIYNTVGEEMAGHSPGILNTEPSSQFAPTMILSNSMITDVFDDAIRNDVSPRSLVVNLHNRINPISIHTDSHTVLQMIESEGNVYSAKQLRVAARSLSKCMFTQLVGLTKLFFTSSERNRANSLSKLPCGPLQSTRDLYMVYGRSVALDELVLTVERIYAKKQTIHSFSATLSSPNAVPYQPYHNQPLSLYTSNHRPLEILPAYYNDEIHWLHRVSGRVLTMLVNMGYNEEIDAHQGLPSPPSIPALSTKEGIGYSGWSCGNQGLFVRGSQQPLLPSLIVPPSERTVRDMQQLLRDQITHYNTLSNASEESAESTEYLISTCQQWVFAVDSVDNEEQLQLIQQEQDDLQCAIDLRLEEQRRIGHKRSSGMDMNLSSFQQQRRREEEQMIPTLAHFGAISFSSQQYHSPQYSREQLGPASAKQSRHNEAELPQSAAMPAPMPIQPFHMGAPGGAGVSSGGTRRERGFQPKSKTTNKKRLEKYLRRKF